MKKLLAVIISSILLGLMPGSNAIKAQGASPPTKPNNAQTEATSKIDWDLTLKKARQEGEVAVIGGTSAAKLRDSGKHFKEKFGIDLLITTGRTSELLPKLLQERRNGLYLQDVGISGQTDLIDTLKPAGALDPVQSMLILPEVVDQKLWYNGSFDWSDEGHYVFNYAFYPDHMVVINTDLVKSGEIQSYYDLLNPKWKEKILINDPTIPGMASDDFTSMVRNALVNLDFFHQLVSQKNMMTRDQDLQATWLAKGKYPIALWPSLGSMARFIDAGAPIRPIVEIKEGTSAGSTGSGLTIFNKAPHPNAAKVFINWFLSREGQTINQKAVGKQTRRIDVPPEGLRSFEMRIPGTKYFPKYDEKEEFILKERKKYTQLAEQIFSPLK